MGLMLAWANDFRAVFWVAADSWCVRPCCFSSSAVSEPERDGNRGPSQPDPARAGCGGFPAPIGGWSASAAVFTLARFSEAFLILRAGAGWPCRLRSPAGAGGQ